LSRLIGTAVNSICLGTCSSVCQESHYSAPLQFFAVDLFLKAGAKVAISFYLARIF